MKEPGEQSDVRLEYDEPLYFPALVEAVRWAEAWLVARKVRAADVVALCKPETIEFVATRRLASWTGLAVVRVSPLFPRQDIFGPPCGPGMRCLVTISQVFVRKPEAEVLDEETIPGAWDTPPGPGADSG
jgi:hypothetical protein